MSESNETPITIEFFDRYHALGVPRPDPKTMCLGKCEGVGCYPVQAHRKLFQEDQVAIARFVAAGGKQEDYPIFRGLYTTLTAEESTAVMTIVAGEGPQDDGWYFMRCPTCNGSGLRPQ